MKLIRKFLDAILNVLAGGSLLVMVSITTYQVFTRYILNDPSSWSEELVSYMFAWASLFGACLVTGERGHMNIPVIVERMPAVWQKVFSAIGELIAMLFSLVILLYGGAQITQLAMGQLTSSLGVAVGVFYVVLPVAGVLTAIYTVLNIYGIAHPGKEKKEG